MKVFSFDMLNVSITFVFLQHGSVAMKQELIINLAHMIVFRSIKLWPMRRSPLNAFMKRQGKERAREAERSVSGGGGCKREDVALHSCF